LTGTTFTTSAAFQQGGAGRTGLFAFNNTLGISTSSGTNLIFNGGELQYSGSAGGSTNRLFSIGTGGGGIIANGTTGQLLFTGGGTIGFNGQSGARTFRLSGTNTGTNTLTTALADNGGQTALVKSGLGRWVLGGTHAYTGTTQIEAGRLTIGAGASIGSSRTVVVGTAAGSGARLDVTDTAYAFTGSQTLMGSGTVAGGGSGPTTVTINGKLSPGNSPGLLTFADTSVALGSTGNVIMEITGSERGTQYDAIDITGGANGGGLTYGGTMTLNFTQTFASGTFDLFKYELNETSGTFGSIVFDPASVYLGTWALVGDVWQVTSGTTVMEFRNNVVEGGVSYGQLVIVPEPLTLGLLGIGGGIAVVGLRHLRRRKANGANGTSTSDSAADAA
jgi:autotransporter-associated beta strand protein